MTTPSNQTDVKFTIRSANRTLPLVKMIVQDVVALSGEISDTRERLEYLSSERDSHAPDDDYSKELDAVKLATDRKSEKVDQCLQELTDLHLMISNVDWGYVDFPATRGDEPVCLCWHFTDEEVMYWHLPDEECADRRPVDLPLIRQLGDRHFSRSV